MSSFSLSADWIVSHKIDFPWEALRGATIMTGDGRSLLVVGVVTRPWPDGPLLDVRYSKDKARHYCKYNISGFTSGRLKVTYPADDGAQILRSFYESVEDTCIAGKGAKQERVGADLKMREVPAVDSHWRKGVEEGDVVATAGEVLNASRQFDLLLFDLDDTLTQSGQLESLRGRANLDNRSEDYVDSVRAEARKLDRLISKDLLVRIRKSFPGLRLGVFTRAPRTYAQTVLAVCFPDFGWDCVIGFEDVPGRTKPQPDGVNKAAHETGVSDIARVAVIGDDEGDLISAYQAGAHNVLYRGGWGSQWSDRHNPNRSDHYRALNLIPDAIIDNPNDLPGFIAQPQNFLPALEAWDSGLVGGEAHIAMRVDVRNHFNPIGEANEPSFVRVHVMGRYFPQSSARHDFRQRERRHRLTSAIIQAKDGTPYPDVWAECCARYIVERATKLPKSSDKLVVCAIPSSPMSSERVGVDRLRAFVGRIRDRIGDRPDILFECGVLEYAEGALPNKMLDQTARFKNVRDHLRVTLGSVVENRFVLVLDDVATSGATFFYADKYLRKAGARDVHCLALAQTIS